MVRFNTLHFTLPRPQQGIAHFFFIPVQPIRKMTHGWGKGSLPFRQQKKENNTESSVNGHLLLVKKVECTYSTVVCRYIASCLQVVLRYITLHNFKRVICREHSSSTVALIQEGINSLRHTSTCFTLVNWDCPARCSF